MSLLQSFKNLTPRTRLLVGAGLLAWGFVGLQVTDPAAEKLLGIPPVAAAAAGEAARPVEREERGDVTGRTR